MKKKEEIKFTPEQISKICEQIVQLYVWKEVTETVKQAKDKNVNITIEHKYKKKKKIRSDLNGRNPKQKQLRERYVEDNLYEQEYLKLQTDFAKGYRKGRHDEKMKVIRIIKSCAGEANALHRIMHKILEENEEEVLKCMKNMNQKYMTTQ